MTCIHTHTYVYRKCCLLRYILYLSFPFIAAGSESLVNYFQKWNFWDKKLYLIFGTSTPNQIHKKVNSRQKGEFSLLKRDNRIMWTKNITKKKFFSKLYKPNMTGFRMLGNSFCTKDLVSLVDPKVPLFESSLLKILAQLHCWYHQVYYIYKLCYMTSIWCYG